MSHGTGHSDLHEQRHANTAGAAKIALLMGVIVLALVYVLVGRHDPRRFWLAYVHNYAFVLSLSLGALFFVLLQHVTRSGWSVVVRRPAEVFAANLGILAVLFVPIACVVASGSGIVYPWARPLSAFAQADSPGHVAGLHEAVSNDADAPHEAGHGHTELILKKRGYLNPPFFIIRWVAYFAIWAGLGWWYYKRSLQQDNSPDATPTLSMQALSAPAMVAFALTLTLASFDLLMSLDPVWFSTIFGVYFFAGSVVGFFALMIITVAGMQRRGLLTASVNAEHYHDLGKLLFGFVFFWGYIAFSQYMLIWYGNLPEETGWFFRRGCAMQAPNAWSYVIVLLLIAHFIVPFVVLLSREVKRQRRLLVFWAAWMFVLHWIDLYWLVMPELTTTHLPLGAAEFGCLIGLGAIFIGGAAWLANNRSLLPVGDPRLPESLEFQNI